MSEGKSLPESKAARKKTNIELWFGARDGDIDCVKSALSKGANINCEMVSVTPLMVASGKGYADIVSFLLEAGADYSISNRYGTTPLIAASIRGYKDVAELLLKAGADPNIANQVNCTALHYAYFNDKKDLIQLLAYNDSTGRLLEQVKLDHKMLQMYVYVDDLKFKELVSKGANPNISHPFQNGQTTAHLAVQRRNIKILTFLLSVSPSLVNSKDGEQTTPLMAASKAGYLDIVQFLLNSGADPSMTNKGQCTALHYAYYYEHEKVIDLLVSSDLTGNLLEQVELDYQLLKATNVTLVKEAINMGANPTIGHPLESFQNAFHLAAKRNDTKSLEFLLSISPSLVDSTDQRDETALHKACARFRIESIRYLLNDGHADPLSLDKGVLLPVEHAPLKHKKHFELLKLFQPFISSKRKLMVDSYPKVILCGDSTAGKSSLAEVIKRRESYRTRNDSKSYCIEGVVPLTSGIVYHQLDRMVLIDFAGHHEYISSHYAVLQNILVSSPAVFLVLIKLTDSEDEIIKKIYYWSQFIENACPRLAAPSTVIFIGSHCDVFKGDIEYISSLICDEASKALFRQKFLCFLPVDCHRPKGEGVQDFRLVLRDSIEEIKDTRNNVSYHFHTLYAYLQSISKVAISLKKLMSLISDLQEPCLPTDESEVKKYLMQLGDKSLIVFLHEAEWIIIDQSALLKEVNGVLFNKTILHTRKVQSSNTGIVPESHLAELFHQYDINMIKAFLVSMEFCHELNSEILPIISTNMSSCGACTSNSESILFFPALVTANRPENIQSSFFKDGTGWILYCHNAYKFFSTRFCEVLFQTCAFSYALSHSLTPGKLNTTSPAIQKLNRSCTVWKNGIYWKNNGDYLLIVTDCNRQLKLLSSHKEDKESLEVFSSLVSQILSLVEKLCPSCEFQEYFMTPAQVQEAVSVDTLNNLTLFKIEEIARSAVLKTNPHGITNGMTEEYHINSSVLVRRREPYFCLLPRVIRELFNEERSDLMVTEESLEHIKSSVSGKIVLFLPSQPTHKHIRELLNKYSLFAGRNPIELSNPKITEKEINEESCKVIVRSKSTLDSKPKPKDLLEYLSPISAQWYMLGSCLLEDDPLVQELLQSEKDCKTKLSLILQRWLDQHRNPTWFIIIDVVSNEPIANGRVCSNIRRFLDNNSEIVSYVNYIDTPDLPDQFKNEVGSKWKIVVYCTIGAVALTLCAFLLGRRYRK